MVAKSLIVFAVCIAFAVGQMNNNNNNNNNNNMGNNNNGGGMGGMGGMGNNQMNRNGQNMNGMNNQRSGMNGMNNVCGRIQASRNVNITCMNAQGDKTPCTENNVVGTIAVMRCKKNYVPVEDLQGSQQRESKCSNVNGMVSWTRPAITCVAEPVAVGYVYFTSVGFFKHYPTQKSWTEAKKICEGDGGNLVVFDSVEERDAAQEYFKNMSSNAAAKDDKKGGKQPAASSSDTNAFYIGVSDTVTDGTMQTVTGGTASGWCVGRPINQVKRPDCATMTRDKWCLADVPCSSRRPFMCEIGIKKEEGDGKMSGSGNNGDSNMDSGSMNKNSGNMNMNMKG